MSRVFWDTMLFIYLLEEHPLHAPRVEYLRRKHMERGDEICTSHLALGELLAGAYKDSAERATALQDAFLKTGIELLPFDTTASHLFGRIRAHSAVSTADSIHLACAGASGVELFLTADKQLCKLRVPGIHFIADMNTDVL